MRQNTTVGPRQMTLLSRKPVRSRSISFARKGTITLICPECKKAAEYTEDQSQFPQKGLLDNEEYDDSLEKYDYFAISQHAICPHCRKGFTVTGFLGLYKYETFDSRDRSSTFTNDEAYRVRREVPESSGFSLGNRRRKA